MPLDIDVLLTDDFSVESLSDALLDIPYEPDFLESLGIFEEDPISTDIVKIESDGNALKLVPATPRGAPVPQRTPNPRNVRAFQTPRVANGDRVKASEIFRVRARGNSSELETVSAEVLRRGNLLRADNNLTMEHHRLGAVQGVVMDSDGTTELYDWFDEWDITPNTEIAFNLAVAGAGSIRTKLSVMSRGMRQKSGGRWNPGTRIYGLAGDTFFDALIANEEIRATYLNQVGADALREAAPVYQTFNYGGVTFVNYQGTDDGSTIAIDPTEVKFFPVGARGVFKKIMSPGETMDDIDTLGQDVYFMSIPDKDRNMWVDLEVYRYHMYVCTRPQMLYSGRSGA
jgi:major capsid protein E